MESIKSKVPSSELETLVFNFHIWVVPDQPFYISIWTKRSLQTRHIINSWLCSVLGCWLMHLITCKKLKYDCVSPTFATPHTLSKSHLENYPLFSIYLLDCRTRNLISWKNSDVKLKRWLLTRQYIITLYQCWQWET